MQDRKTSDTQTATDAEEKEINELRELIRKYRGAPIKRDSSKSITTLNQSIFNQRTHDRLDTTDETELSYINSEGRRVVLE